MNKLMNAENGMLASDAAQLYFEVAGQGTPMVMLHAGIADSRQWQPNFDFFAKNYRVARYDMRGFGRSKPVAGSYRNLGDLENVLEHLNFEVPMVLVGCSMGGTLAMDFCLSHPGQVSALVMVCSGPSGLNLDVPVPQKFAQVEVADEAGDLELVNELETQIWFDGDTRTPAQMDANLRALVKDMNGKALQYDAQGLGEREHDISPAAYKRLAELDLPVLVITGALDIPYMQAAAAFMLAEIQDCRHQVISATTHLPNLERPEVFNRLVADFLQEVL